MIEDTKERMLEHLTINFRDCMGIDAKELEEAFREYRLQSVPSSYRNNVVLVPRAEKKVVAPIVYRCNYCQANAHENPCEYCGSPKN